MNSFKKFYQSYRCETDPSITSTEINTLSKKREFLFSHKSSLETLLSIIKKNQMSFLSNLSKHNNNNVNKILKVILVELKESLNSMYIQQGVKSSFLESQLSEQKSLIQSNIYEISKKNIHFQKLKTEIEQLRILNFKAENDIILIDNLIIKNHCINEYLNKSINNNYNEKDINCLKPKFYSIITGLLHKESIETKNYFKNVVSKKQDQEDRIYNTQKKIEHLKLCIKNKQYGFNNYIYAEDIIPEESKEYSQSMNINNINKTINKIIMKKNRKNMVGQEIEEFESDNSNSSSGNNNKNEGNNLNNFINLNMNINLNFNFDKYNITEDIKYNSDREIDNKHKKNLKIDDKKGFLSTGSLPYLIINYIKEEAKSSENSKEKKEIVKHKNKKIKSNDISPEEYLVTV